jgi:hypothetical protein
LIGGPTSPLGQNIPPELAQYWNQLMQNFPQNVGGQQAVPTTGQPYPGVTNPIWGSGQTTQPQSLLKLKVKILGVTIRFNHHQTNQDLLSGGRLHTVPLVYR